MRPAFTPERFAASFLRLFLTAAAACVLSYLIFRRTTALYAAVPPTGSGWADGVRAYIRAEIPSALLLAATVAAGFTAFRRPVLAVGCLWRGASLGCAGAFLSGGRLAGVPAAPTMTFAALAAGFWLCAAAVSDAAGPALLRAAGDAERFRALLRPHLRLCLVFAGAVFLAEAALLL